MGRWRPPSTPGSKYITPAGYARLETELERLWREERPRVCSAVSEAAALGDRSENAEYIYGKKQLRAIDSRVRFLHKRLEGMTVVKEPPAEPDRVFFGAWVDLEDDDGQQVTYRIVGPDEFDMHEAYISMDSPIARALLGKRLDDEITVQLPRGNRRFLIEAIRYIP